MENWVKEIKSCKKISKNIVTKKQTNKITENLMEKLNNRKYYTEEIEQTDNTEYYYKLEKNKTLGIDKNTDKKLKSGKIKIDLKVDFHGLTINEAFDLLKNTIENAYNSGLKLILFITGKGNGTKKDRDSIKSLIGNWMKTPFISSKVIKYTDAQQKDGGTGAIYVLLKNKNKVKKL